MNDCLSESGGSIRRTLGQISTRIGQVRPRILNPFYFFFYFLGRNAESTPQASFMCVILSLRQARAKGPPRKESEAPQTPVDATARHSGFLALSPNCVSAIAGRERRTKSPEFGCNHRRYALRAYGAHERTDAACTVTHMPWTERLSSLYGSLLVGISRRDGCRVQLWPLRARCSNLGAGPHYLNLLRYETVAFIAALDRHYDMQVKMEINPAHSSSSCFTGRRTLTAEPPSVLVPTPESEYSRP
jgi:hypothetical protein